MFVDEAFDILGFDTEMKYNVFKISIRRLIDSERVKVKERHEKKLDKLRVESAVKNGTKKTPSRMGMFISWIFLSYQTESRTFTRNRRTRVCIRTMKATFHGGTRFPGHALCSTAQRKSVQTQDCSKRSEIASVKFFRGMVFHHMYERR